MHEKDKALIQSIQDFFGGIGYVSKTNKTSTVEFRVSTSKDLIDVILPHFDKYPLITKKHSDYLLFKQIVLLMLDKKHNTLEGIEEIVKFRASLNLGLPDYLKEAFPNTISVFSNNNLEGLTKNKKLYPEWVGGFCTGESNFFIALQKSKTKSGLSVSFLFSIAQHSKDLPLFESFVNFFDSGSVVDYKKRPLCEFIITKIDDIIEHVIPFFEKYPILGSKHLNFLDFKSAADIIKSKEHLSEDGLGLSKISQLKERVTALYKNKIRNNHGNINGTEKYDQKR
jgi:hypothetical protein